MTTVNDGRTVADGLFTTWWRRLATRRASASTALLENATIYVKAEFFNPAGSVKDRLALSIIETAERKRHAEAGQTVVRPRAANGDRARDVSAAKAIARRDDGRQLLDRRRS